MVMFSGVWSPHDTSRWQALANKPTGPFPGAKPSACGPVLAYFGARSFALIKDRFQYEAYLGILGRTFNTVPNWGGFFSFSGDARLSKIQAAALCRESKSSSLQPSCPVRKECSCLY